MKAFLIWTLSFLLAWEPFALATSKTFDADVKSYVEKSQITKKRLTVKELFKFSSGFVPKELLGQLQPMLDKMGDYQLPKFDLTRVKGPSGEEAFQFTATQDGKSVSFMLVNGENGVFGRVNGQTISKEHPISMTELMMKFGMTSEQASEVVTSPRNPASASGLLSADQVMKLDRSSRKKYFKQLRDLLSAIEETQNAFMNSKKTSSTTKTNSDKYSVLFALLNPEANAQMVRNSSDDNASCMAAGYATVVRWNDQRIDPKTHKLQAGYSCGSDGHGGALPELRRKSNGEYCSQNQFACNPSIYGDGNTCVSVTNSATRDCNSAVVRNGNDIPDLTKNNKQQFNDLKANAERQVTRLTDLCGKPPFTYVNSQLTQDQAQTCSNLSLRKATIESWDCGRSQFAQKYPTLCPVAQQPPVAQPQPVAPQPPVAQPQPTQPAQGKCPDGKGSCFYCDSLPGNMTDKNISCANHSSEYGATCLNRDGSAHFAKVCECYGGAQAVNFACPAGSATADNGDDGSSHHSRRAKAKAKGPNWWVIGGVAAAFLGLYAWIDKSSAKDQFKYLSAVATTPSTSSTVTTVPTPRVDPGVR